MGMCISCCRGSTGGESVITPSLAIRRQTQEEAARKRQQESNFRGIKDPEKFRRDQKKKEDYERMEEEAARQGNQPALKWQTS